MDLRGLAFVGCRLLALYFLVECLTASAGVIALILQSGAVADTFTGNWSQIAQSLWELLAMAVTSPATAATAVTAGLYALSSTLLWFAAGPISAGVAALDASRRRQFGGIALSRVVLTAAGVLVLAGGVDDAARLIQLLSATWVGAELPATGLYLVEPSVAVLLKLLLGNGLLLGAGLQALLANAEREGVVLAPRRDLSDASLIGAVGELASAAHSLGVRAVSDLAQRVVKSSFDSIITAAENRKTDFSAVAASDGQVTIVFSDMEGFTAMTQKLGDAQAHKIIKVHNKVVRDAVAAHQGQEVELQGDGFLLAFAESADALRCAATIQRNLRRHNSRHRQAPIRVRIGMHCGRPIKEGERFFGLTVIMAARIAAQANGGETLVSEAVYQVLADKPEFSFGDPLEAELKGLDGMHKMYPLE